MFTSTQTVWDFMPILLKGLWVTLALSVLALVIGFLLGAVIGSSKIYGNKTVRLVASMYISVFRSIPPLLMFFGAFYGVAYAAGFEISPFQAALIAMVLNASAQLAEVIRGALKSIGKGQWEGAQALGLGFWSTLKIVVAPQAFRVLIPPTIGVFVSVVKDSSFASAIGLVEFTQTGLMVRGTTGDSLTVFLLLAAVYFVVNYGISLVSYRMEKRLQLTLR